MLDLRLFELDVLANDRVVLLQHELVRGALAVLRGRIEVARVRRRHETDELAARFTLLRHSYLPGGTGLMACRAAPWQGFPTRSAGAAETASTARNIGNTRG